MATETIIDSIGSTQWQDFESLREQLLQKQHGLSPSHTRHRSIASPPHLRASQIQDSQQLRHDRRVGARDGHPPQLNATRSAPDLQMAMVDDTPSQRTRVLAATFHAFPGGDTQLMESQVYRDYNPDSIEPLNFNTPARPIIAVESTTAKSLVDESHTELAVHADGQDVNSYIDLAQAWPEQMSQTAKSTTSEMEDFLVSPQTERMKKGAERTVIMPQTPYAADEHHVLGDAFTVERSSKTPGIDFAFGASRTPMISATQLFHQTQAISSPAPDAIRSDPVYTRPSPNLQEDTVFHSNLGYSSSPAMVRQRPSSTAGEPRDWYTSMHESQERRERDRVTGKLPTIEEASNESMGSILRKHNRNHFRRTLSDQIPPSRRSTRIVSPSNLEGGLLHKRRRLSNGSAMSAEQDHEVDPAELQPSRGDIVRATTEEDEDRATEDDDNQLPDQDAEDNEPMDDDDTYDEYGQTILRSQAQDDEDLPIESPNKLLAHIGHTDRSNVISISSQPHGHDPGRVFQHTQPSAVVDSQGGAQSATKRSLLSAFHDQGSSMTNVVPGSQYAVTLSQNIPRHAQQYSSQAVLEDQIMTDARVPSSPPLATSNDVVDGKTASGIVSNEPSGNVYVTARSNILNDIPEQSTASANLPDTQDSMITPLKRAGALRFSDIAGSQRLHHEDSIDIDGIMEGVITHEDEQYMAAMRSPSQGPRKRRRVARTIVSSDPASSAQKQQLGPGQHAKDTEQDNAEDSHSLADARTDAPMPVVSASQGGNPASPEVVLQPHNGDTLENHASQSTETPASVRRRERKGAHAMSQLVSTRSTADASVSRPSAHKKQTYSHKRKRQHQTPHELPTSVRETAASKDEPDAALAPENATSKCADSPQAEVEHGSPAMAAPQRVFALFGGGFNAYYPATVLSRSSDGSMFSVRFDDTSLLDVKASEVFALSFKIGDLVKVDIPIMRKSIWIVQGFSATSTISTDCDAHGHTVLKVQAKATQRKSLSTAPQGEGPEHQVDVTNVYLTHSLASAFRTRKVADEMGAQLQAQRPSTPALAVSATDLGTPLSRSGRKLKVITRASANNSPTLHDRCTTKLVKAEAGGIFSNMAFAVSVSTGEVERKDLTRAIENNGGHIVDKGFEDLFVLPKSAVETNVDLVLKPAYKQLGFVALIANSCTRRAKYVQALALGLPTLSSRWIRDSLDGTRNEFLASDKPRALSWSRYLLPAGESLYLDGAIRSRTLLPVAPEAASLASTLYSRARLLDHDKVLLVAPQKNRNNTSQDRAHLYSFLSMAMGAGSIRRVASLADASAIVRADPSWAWVHVDSDVDAASKLLFGATTTSTKGKKKANKSTADVGKGKSVRLYAKSEDRRLTVVSDEYVIQSLILGDLLD